MKRRRSYRLGDLATWLGAGEWFVIVDNSRIQWPVGVCIVSSQPERIGQRYGMANETRMVPEDEVPDHVWAALAAWRLTQ